mmetsp:Transcript_1162/g.3052  ORF Transcript_1162/g.3052 Transcript_1162/m.3052 type:complete len:236 (+) Transcript_1162:183-890(+)|eukprot:CAMPEP_0173448644 /NCGR_PEP_ID=MMETSP1357-20121228/41169_1 /TAXON_ID=77926 /ORGANISM="Hemiselmis rufescens, Strain PCC563" /LENGTH=235 /DNA_ID=CAMNT_0014415175 /DNA_START=140 /DNA_END=847 /DNA_ORIENTATION=+
MAKPLSLPKSDKEKEFAKMMRAQKQQGGSVWEDSRGRGKGSGFRSLKKNSMSLNGASGDSHSHGRSQSQMQMHHREPSYGLPQEVSRGRSSSVLPSLSRSLGPNRRWVDDEHKWQGVTRAECGRVFGGEMVSHGLGVTLARQEHLIAAAQKRARNLEVVAHLMQVYPDGLPLPKPQDPNDSGDVDFLPFIGNTAGQRSPAKARMGPGYMRVESQEPTLLLGGRLRQYGKLRGTKY